MSPAKRLAVLAAVAAVALAMVLALAACSSAPTAAETKAKCFANEAELRTMMKLFSADTGGIEAPFASVVAKTGAKCPSGGTYSWDSATGVVTCSVHGHP
jgi:pectin methylesterase-like acyl-CoA thioesterase